jgi:hypothetical protein
LYLRGEEGEKKGHAADGVEEYYDNDDQVNITKGLTEKQMKQV